MDRLSRHSKYVSGAEKNGSSGRRAPVTGWRQQPVTGLFSVSAPCTQALPQLATPGSLQVVKSPVYQTCQQTHQPSSVVQVHQDPPLPQWDVELFKKKTSKLSLISCCNPFPFPKSGSPTTTDLLSVTVAELPPLLLLGSSAVTIVISDGFLP